MGKKDTCEGAPGTRTPFTAAETWSGLPHFTAGFCDVFTRQSSKKKSMETKKAFEQGGI